MTNFANTLQGWPMSKKLRIAYNERGARIGESHPGARLTDHEVDLVMGLVEDGWSYARVAEKFGVSKTCIAKIASGRRRCQTPARVIEVACP